MYRWRIDCEEGEVRGTCTPYSSHLSFCITTSLVSPDRSIAQIIKYNKFAHTSKVVQKSENRKLARRFTYCFHRRKHKNHRCRLYFDSHSLQDIRTIGVSNNTYIMMVIYTYIHYTYIYTVRKRKSRSTIVGFRYRGRNYTVRGKCTRARIIQTITTYTEYYRKKHDHRVSPQIVTTTNYSVCPLKWVSPSI